MLWKMKKWIRPSPCYVMEHPWAWSMWSNVPFTAVVRVDFSNLWGNGCQSGKKMWKWGGTPRRWFPELVEKNGRGTRIRATPTKGSQGRYPLRTGIQRNAEYLEQQDLKLWSAGRNRKFQRMWFLQVSRSLNDGWFCWGLCLRITRTYFGAKVWRKEQRSIYESAKF